MAGKFVIRKEVSPEVLDWGELRWLSNPPTTGAGQLTVIDVTPRLRARGTTSTSTPTRRRCCSIVAGEVEQWIGEEKRILYAGDSAFVPKGVVHASFNAGEGEALIAAILGPCVGEVGYVSVEMGAEAPWNTLR